MPRTWSWLPRLLRSELHHGIEHEQARPGGIHGLLNKAWEACFSRVCKADSYAEHGAQHVPRGKWSPCFAQDGQTRLSKAFDTFDPLPEAAIAKVVELLRSGRLHRYCNSHESEASMLESEFASWLGQPYCLACTSGGFALQIALRASGLAPGDEVLTNAFTLAPVPGAIVAAGGKPVLVEVSEDYGVDLDHLEALMEERQCRFLLLSHMRGYMANMRKVSELCQRYSVCLIEDCAHSLGGEWGGKQAGTFGRVGCFSTQSFKHLNSGEGGLLSTRDAELMRRAVVLSGSYAFHHTHAAAPPADALFEAALLCSPNLSGRLDELRAAVLRPQLPLLPARLARWRTLHATAARALASVDGLEVPAAAAAGSFLLFRVSASHPAAPRLPRLLSLCAARGVPLTWSGAASPRAYAAPFHSWRFLGPAPAPPLPATRRILALTLELRVPLSLPPADFGVIAAVLREAMAQIAAEQHVTNT